MGVLQLAIAAHKNKDLEKAASYYKQAYEKRIKDPVLYQNYGSLFRELGENDKALKVYERGLSLFPDHLGIQGNKSNILMLTKPVSSLEICLNILLAARSIPNDDKRKAIEKHAFSNILYILKDQSCDYWKLLFLKYYYVGNETEVGVLVHLLTMVADTDSVDESLENEFKSKHDSLDTLSKTEVSFS